MVQRENTIRVGETQSKLKGSAGFLLIFGWIGELVDDLGAFLHGPELARHIEQWIINVLVTAHPASLFLLFYTNAVDVFVCATAPDVGARIVPANGDDHGSIRSAASFTVDAYWLGSPVSLVLKNNSGGSDVTTIAASEKVRAALVVAQARDFAER